MQLAKSIIIAFLAATATTFAAPVPAPEANTDATLPTGGQLVMGIIVDEVNDADNSKIIAFPGGRGRPRRPYPGDPTVIIIKPYGPYGPISGRGNPGRARSALSTSRRKGTSMLTWTRSQSFWSFQTLPVKVSHLKDSPKIQVPPMKSLTATSSPGTQPRRAPAM